MNMATKETDQTATVTGFLGGLLIGGIAGAGAMVLLAPRSGKKTRRQMRRKVNDVREQATETIESGLTRTRTKAHDVSATIMEQAEALQRRGHEVIDEGMERFTTTVDAGKTAVKGS